MLIDFSFGTSGNSYLTWMISLRASELTNFTWLALSLLSLPLVFSPNFELQLRKTPRLKEMKSFWRKWQWKLGKH